MTSAVHDYSYSVQVKSRFDLLGNDDFNNEDPEILLKKMRSQKRDHKVTAPAVEKSIEKSVEPLNRGEESANKGESWEGRDRGARGRGGFTRSRPTRPGAPREFDRHSGSNKTGVKAVVKKDGHGAGNWGTIEDELEAQVGEPVVDAADPTSPVSSGENSAEDSGVPVEEEPKTLTLKEYLDQKKAAAKQKVQLSTKGTRRPNDGKNVFSNMVEVHKSKPVQTKVEVVLEDAKPASEDPSTFLYREGGRGRGRGEFRGNNRQQGEFKGRGAANVQHASTSREEPIQEEAQADSAAVPSDRPQRGRGRGRGGFEGGRGGRGSYEGSRGRGGTEGGRGRGAFEGGRGRGGFEGGRGRGGRGGFEGRGRGRGGFEGRGRGGHEGQERRRYDSERSGRASVDGEGGEHRGGSRGRGGPRTSGRGFGSGGAGDRPSFRGGRGGPRGAGGPRGGFRGGRGGFEQHQDAQRPAARAVAPSMDSDEHFPALK